MAETRDHGGRIDAAVARWGGTRGDWMDLSTGINPVPYPVPDIPAPDWTALPDHAAETALIDAARRFWSVPEGVAILPAPGASALIAQIPRTRPPGAVHIAEPTYNEHRAAFEAAGHHVGGPDAPVHVRVHPNNPDGRLFDDAVAPRDLTVIDESFCDVTPGASHIPATATPGTIVLKSFGKFWGLAGLRLGFAMGHPETLGAIALGPWAVSGPALRIGTAALRDTAWARNTRERLARDSAALDAMMTRAGAAVVGGTTLFRLYEVDDAAHWHDRLAARRILTRTFPYAPRWLRLGLPHPQETGRLADALGSLR